MIFLWIFAKIVQTTAMYASLRLLIQSLNFEGLFFFLPQLGRTKIMSQNLNPVRKLGKSMSKILHHKSFCWGNNQLLQP